MDALEARMAHLRRAHDLLDLQIGREYTIYKDDAAVAQLGATGLLQMWLLASKEQRYMERLYKWWKPAADARILDVGCGNGRLAELLYDDHHKALVVPLNTSHSQLRQCDLECVQGDMHALPFPDGTFTDVLLCYALGYGLPEIVFAEISRVLVLGGTCVFMDITADDYAFTLCTLGYKPYPWRRVREAAHTVGLFRDVYQNVGFIGTLHSAFCDLPQGVLNRLRGETRPVFVTFVKEAHDARHA